MVPLMSLQLVHPMPWIQSPAELFLMYQWMENMYVTGFLWMFRILMYVIYGFNLRYSFYVFLTVFLRIVYVFFLRIIYGLFTYSFYGLFMYSSYGLFMDYFYGFFHGLFTYSCYVFFYGLFTYAINLHVIYVYL